MQRCLQLAALGFGKTSPNPMVGAVIVCDGKIIGEGYHHKCGEAHAEINAINSVKDKELLTKSTLYVNLEPCSHHGKTPPCADAIIQHKIPKVVIGSIDHNSKVNGSGISKLQNAGIDLVINVCQKDCETLNSRFFSFHKKQRPYIILKWAQTNDGFMDIDRDLDKGKSNWITNPALKVLVHKWRSEEDAIIVGFNTIKNDNPQLTTREYVGKNPKRFVMQRGTEIISKNSYNPISENVREAINQLYNFGVQSVIVEGGRRTICKFLDSEMWDEARILLGNINWGRGLKAPEIPKIPNEIIDIDGNKLIYVRRYL